MVLFNFGGIGDGGSTRKSAPRVDLFLVKERVLASAMGWEGLTGAGAGFIGVGLWRAYSTSCDNKPSSSIRAKRFHCDIENVVVAALAVLHILGSVVTSRKDWRTGYILASAMALERSCVAAMFLVYAITAIVRERSRVLPLPREAVKLLAVVGFGLEFLLFYLKEGDETGIENQYRGLLLVPIGVCLLATALQIAYPLNGLLAFIQSMALILQGTWFVQMAVSLFTNAGIAQGCWLDEKGEGDYAVHCKGMSSMRGKAIATLQFNLHLAVLLLVMLPVYALLNRTNGPPPIRYQQLGSNCVAEETRAGTFQLSERASNGTTYVLEDEDAQ